MAAAKLATMLQLCRQAAVVAFVLGASLRAGPWPEVQSDLTPDPSVSWGVLPNGLRYAVRHNAEPKGRASLRLLVAAGSIDERESERGIAHFIEHMAFRGTNEHPNGGLTAELQRLGIGFGPDTAAFTFWDHTIYRLELPDTGESTLREALGVFREYAQDISFEPYLISRERDVILNERDTRDTPGARAQNANLDLLWPDSLQVRRMPIGLAENIQGFTRGQFISFYDGWYRPDRMVVIVVGDVDPDAVVRLVGSAMGGIAARGPARADEIQLAPLDSGRPDIRVFVDQGFPGAECKMEHPFPEPAAPDTHARRAAQLKRALAFAMLQHRAARLSKNSDERFVVPVANVTHPVSGWALATFGASGTIDDWKAFMADLEREHRRAFMYGFTAAELAVARTAFTAAYEDSVRTAATWHSDWIAGLIANSIVEGSVFATPAAAQRDVAADLAAATPADCLAEYRRAWTAQSMDVFVATNPKFRVTAAKIAGALNASRGTPVTRPVETAPAAFAHSDFGPAGHTVGSEQVKDLDVWEARFSNGVRLNFKATSFEAGSVAVCVRVGTGRLSLPESKPGLDLLANAIVPFGGLGRHSAEDLQDVLAGHTVSVNFGVDSDALDFNARYASKDLGLCLQLIAAYLTDTAYRRDALTQVKASLGSMYAAIASSPGGPITMQAPRVLSGGDRRFGTATPTEMSARTIDEVRDWIEPQFKDGPIELSVVGDATWEETAAPVGTTLGALHPRMERSKAMASQMVGAPQKPSQPVYVSTTDQSLRQVAITWFCPVPDLSGVHMERRCRLLAAVLAERMRVRLRDGLGAAYGFDADFIQFDGFPDFSFFVASTTVSPENARITNDFIRSEMESLEEGRLTDDEFEWVKLPFLTKRDEDVRNNGFWSYTVLRDAQQRPDRLLAARDRQADCAAIGRSDVEGLAARYFGHGRWFRFVAYPRVAPEGQAPVLPFGEKVKFGADH